MAETINPLLLNSRLIKLPENQNSIGVENLPPAIVSQLKAGATAVLEIVVDMNGQFSAFLQMGDGKTNINIPQSWAEAVSAGQTASIPVRIGTGGRLFPLPESQNTADNPVITQTGTSVSDVLGRIEVAPLKPEHFVSRILEQSDVPQNIKEQIELLLPPLEVSLAEIGGKEEIAGVLRPLQNILRQIAGQPQEFDNLKPQLLQAVKDLAGMQISGRITERVNEMTVIETPLGKTFFESKVKLPLSENVLLNIGTPTPAGLPEIKFMDSLLKILFVAKPEAVSPEKLAKSPQLKGLPEIAALKPEILPAILKSLPFQSENLLENMYRFYQGAVNKAPEQWLGHKILSEIAHDTAADRAVVKELGTFLSNAVKETPVWRIVEMPLFDGNAFSALKVAVKKDTEKEKQSEPHKKSGTRFIVETDFSKLGGFQFDGFSNIKQRSLDLIVRTTQNMDDDFCSNIINLFKKSLYSLNYTGTIKINSRQAFINLYDENQINTGIYI